MRLLIAGQLAVIVVAGLFAGYLYPGLLPMALFAGMSWSRLLASSRAPIAIATISALICAVAWADAVGRYLDA